MHPRGACGILSRHFADALKTFGRNDADMENQTFETAKAPEPRPLVADGAWAGILGQHPCLLGPRDFLRSLARTRPRDYEEIRTMDSLLAAGIVHAVEGADDARVEPFLRRAAE
ncbi:unnamed protein product, partial [marine sediment metagenome]